jgi:hypothetical protein
MGGIANSRQIALLGFAVSLVLGASPDVGAGAAARESVMTALDGDHNNVGNGKQNRNATVIRSRLLQQGAQQVATTNVGGSANVQNALCKKMSHCKIRQKERLNTNTVNGSASIKGSVTCSVQRHYVRTQACHRVSRHPR